MRRWKRFRTSIREWKMVAKALISQGHPMLVHIIPMRRCNLSCAYCNEYDDVSKPVETEIMFRRIGQLAELGTSIITISGGEPLMHPELESIIAEIRRRGMLAGLITNGYLLSRKRIQSLNEAGLEHLQISIDNVEPDETSMKSLKVLDKKLRYLAELADFKVNINSVLGSEVNNPEDALTIGRRAVELGFSCTVGLIHDGSGALKALGEKERQIFLSGEGSGQEELCPGESLFSGQSGQWKVQRMALQGRCPLLIRLRGWCGALLLTAKRIPGGCPEGIHTGTYSPRVSHRKTLCPELHYFLCAFFFHGRFLAGASDTQGVCSPE
jgi:organic radical activating enzyme